MSTDNMLHLAEIVILGIPMWYGLIKFFIIAKEFPPHLHERDGGIRFPRGWEPGSVVNGRDRRQP